MPAWLYRQLEKGPKIDRFKVIDRHGRLTTREAAQNETSDIVPMLARLSELDPGVGYAYYCHPEVDHVFKTPNEGGFCGYRNIQMQVSFIRNTKAQGHDKFSEKRSPGILMLQDLIEDAWDNGRCEISRDQIGKLRGTRKWIGTLEVCLAHPVSLAN
jgi:hypothetical protein